MGRLKGSVDPSNIGRAFVEYAFLLMQGWLVPDRVIDGPVYQDALTWEDHGLASQE
jgi:hypothetical protein